MALVFFYYWCDHAVEKGVNAKKKTGRETDGLFL